jgi:hypothetical protein
MVPDVPAELSAVCMGLLRRNPEQRLSEEWMAAQHIRNPMVFTRMLAPGFPDLP